MVKFILIFTFFIDFKIMPWAAVGCMGDSSSWPVGEDGGPSFSKFLSRKVFGGARKLKGARKTKGVFIFSENDCVGSILRI